MLYQTESGQIIYYEIIGHGTPIVCFHGNNQSVSYFKNQLLLAEDYQLILIDSPGHGKSSLLLHKTTFAQIANGVKELLDSLGLTSYVLLGHSDGANLAIAFENNYPERVTGLLLNAGNISFSGLTQRSKYHIMVKVFKLRILAILFENYRNPYYVASLMMENQVITPSVLSNRIPVYVVVGDHDMIKAEHSLEIANQYQNSRLLKISRAGHNIPGKNSDRFNAIVRELIQEIESI